MQAGGGVWHTGEPVGDRPGQGFQLWVALPAALESAPAFSRYLAPAAVPPVGPARVLLGRYGAVHSAVEVPSEMTYLSVTLAAGERWRYTPRAGHTVAWVAVASGRLVAGEPVAAGELAGFESSEADIHFVAETDTRFVLGSAVPHPHPLVMGSYSVHTNADALARGEAEIRRIGLGLRDTGRLG
jgi:redox-sensitive bicupin YhaK (pirin superfamily)